MEKKQYPLISIVLATYNGEKFLIEQLESLIHQTYPNFEIIVVDDCSQDQTKSILLKYQYQYKNIRVYFNEKNLGFIKNFEKGCNLAKGEYISPCDQDDVWDINKILLLYENLEHYPMIFCDSFVCDAELNKKGKKISDKVNYINIHSCLQQSIYCRIYGHATLFKRNIFEKSSPFITEIPHDWWLCFNASLNGGIKYLNQPLVYYRQHENNAIGVIGEKKRVAHKQQKNVNEVQQIRKRIEIFYNTCPPEKQFEKQILASLNKTYTDFSLGNNFNRMVLFLKYFPLLLAVKKKSTFMKVLFCFKMFFKVK